MGITDELREYIWQHATNNDELRAIADRIDAEHQKAEDKWKAKDGQTWLKGYAECLAELREGNEAITASLEDAGWVKLPVDADGVLIHAGDVLDGYGKTIEVVELRIGRSGWVIVSRDGNAYADTFAFSHHHASTVEDVLRECIANVCRSNAQLHEQGCPPLTMEDIDEELDEYINEYAVKLRLTDDGKER